MRLAISTTETLTDLKTDLVVANNNNNLPTLRYRHIRGDMIEVFKIPKYYDSDPSQILQRHTSSATCGHSLKLAKKQSNSNLRLYSFSNRVINNLNNLSNHVVSSSNANTFKNRLISHWKTIQLDTTGKQVTTSILVMPILIINAELRSHSSSGKRGGIRLLPEFTIRYNLHCPYYY